MSQFCICSPNNTDQTKDYNKMTHRADVHDVVGSKYQGIVSQLTFLINL